MRAPGAMPSAPGALSIDVAESTQAITAVAPEWEALHRRSGPRRNPFLGFDWTELCRRTDYQQCKPLVLLARSGGELLGIAPLCVGSHLGFRVARFIADRRSDYLGFLCAAGHDGVEAALFRHLLTLPPPLDLVELRRLCDDYTGLGGIPSGPSHLDVAIEGTSAHYTRGAGTWEELCRTGPHWLSRMRRKVRKFEAAGGTAERYLGAAAADRLEEAAVVESRSWKATRGMAQLAHEGERALLREALGRLGDRGELELWIARVGSVPVAFEINFLSDDWIGLYQGAHDEAFRHLGPGAVLELLSIRRAWDGGVREYDYMTGVGDYKTERTQARRSVGARIIRPRSLRGEAAFRILVDGPRRLRGLRALRALRETSVGARVTVLRQRVASILRRA